MKKISLTILLSLAGSGLAGCSSSTTTDSNARGNSAVNVVSNANSAANAGAANANLNLSNATSRISDPTAFMPEAAIGGMAEVEMSKLAVGKTKNAEVKQFAQQMIAEHTRANNELKTLAGKKNVVLPADLDAGHKALAEKLSGLSGAEFDKAYMESQVADHERSVGLFQNQADGGIDAEAKTFAAKMLPNLKMHLEMAQKLNAKLK